MLPEIGASELLVIAVVALIVVGPKDLPMLLRKLGQFLAKLRGMASEFRASFDEMARQSELDELRKEVEAMRAGQLTDMAAKASGIEDTAAFDEISQGLTDVGVQLHPPMSYQYEAAAVAEEVQPIAKPPRKPRAKATPTKAQTTKAQTTKPPAKAKSAASTVAAPKTTMKIAKATPKRSLAKPRKSTAERG